MKACPFCAQLIQDAAIKCRHCQQLLVDPEQAGLRVAPPSPGEDTAIGTTRVSYMTKPGEVAAAGKLIVAHHWVCFEPGRFALSRIQPIYIPIQEIANVTRLGNWYTKYYTGIELKNGDVWLFGVETSWLAAMLYRTGWSPMPNAQQGGARR